MHLSSRKIGNTPLYSTQDKIMWVHTRVQTHAYLWRWLLQGCQTWFLDFVIALDLLHDCLMVNLHGFIAIYGAFFIRVSFFHGIRIRKSGLCGHGDVGVPRFLGHGSRFEGLLPGSGDRKGWHFASSSIQRWRTCGFVLIFGRSSFLALLLVLLVIFSSVRSRFVLIGIACTACLVDKTGIFQRPAAFCSSKCRCSPEWRLVLEASWCNGRALMKFGLGPFVNQPRLLGQGNVILALRSQRDHVMVKYKRWHMRILRLLQE